ncbi:MAG: ABC transporter ATP-binding protein [Clostridia bacterium]|nr:ABC transporter ATP-binding protein [Clostridia bacterium]
METVLKAENLRKNGILHGVTFEIGKGEMVAVMGPSGSGKSTLLYNVSGMDTPDAGRVWLGNEEITAMTEDEKARLRLHRMGFVFQQMHMVEHLNILDNVLLPAVQAAKENKRPKAERRALTEKAERLMQKLSVEGLGARSVRAVSGGQLQRACIARSLMNDPEILFADEPTGALNRSAADEVMDTLTALNREGTTVLMVTHDSRMAARCGRILCLLDGRIVDSVELPREATLAENEALVNRRLAEMGW